MSDLIHVVSIATVSSLLNKIKEELTRKEGEVKIIITSSDYKKFNLLFLFSYESGAKMELVLRGPEDVISLTNAVNAWASKGLNIGNIQTHPNLLESAP